MHDEPCDTPPSGMPPSLQESLEAVIRRAGSYVVPSENLRANTISSAIDRWNYHRNARRFYRVMVIASCSFAAVLYAFQGFAWLNESVDHSPAEQIQSDMQKYSSDQRIGPDWAVQESYRRLREDQFRQFQSILFEPTQASH